MKIYSALKVWQDIYKGKRTGGMAYHQFTNKERYYFEQRLSDGDGIANIAKTPDRHKTTL